ncbi:hypothetical protein KIPB_001202 [Kipferlia bialata]|uniref:Transmembrane protein n=1 Tax=Kipferlia bialata TaxID=797122 RepID=A0A391NLQ3_9EUKA|nr:hypothetical protein KIPB_001202 [Kipferlia bialata]|eukprot:g1202.t1
MPTGGSVVLAESDTPATPTQKGSYPSRLDGLPDNSERDVKRETELVAVSPRTDNQGVSLGVALYIRTVVERALADGRERARTRRREREEAAERARLEEEKRWQLAARQRHTMVDTSLNAMVAAARSKEPLCYREGDAKIEPAVTLESTSYTERRDKGRRYMLGICLCIAVGGVMAYASYRRRKH